MVNKLNEDYFLKEFDDWLTTSSRLHTVNPGRGLLKISNNLKFGQRGIIACCEIKANQCCYSVPLNDIRLILTPLRCAYLLNHCPCFKHSKHQANLNSLDTLIAFIYHCKCSTSTECILKTIWSPYLSVLPEIYSDPLSCILFNIEYLFERIFKVNSSSYFHSNDIDIKLKCLLTRLLRSWYFIKPIFNNNNDSTANVYYKRYSIPPKEFLWAWCTVNSRCVSCPFKDSLSQIQHLYNVLLVGYNLKDPKFFNDYEVVSLLMNSKNKHTIALIPFFDFFNHDQTVPTSLLLSKTSLSLELYLDSSVSVNEQVFISYGAHDNLTLFTEYGFILPFNEKNTNEVIYLSYRFIVNLFLHLMDSFTTPINGMSGSCNSTSMSNLIESFTHNRIIANKFETLQHSYSTTLCLYFHRILGKLNLCVPYNSADNHDSDDDVTWSSVYLSLNGSNNNRGPSYHLGLILFLLHTLISNMNNNNDKTLVDCQSLDNVYHISEDTIYTTIQTLLNRIYTILLDQLKYDREKIVHLMNTTTYQHDSSALLSSVHMKSTCLIDKFCKDFLYYFDQRECFIRSLMTS